MKQFFKKNYKSMISKHQQTSLREQQTSCATCSNRETDRSSLIQKPRYARPSMPCYIKNTTFRQHYTPYLCDKSTESPGVTSPSSISGDLTPSWLYLKLLSERDIGARSLPDMGSTRCVLELSLRIQRRTYSTSGTSGEDGPDFSCGEGLWFY